MPVFFSYEQYRVGQSGIIFSKRAFHNTETPSRRRMRRHQYDSRHTRVTSLSRDASFAARGDFRLGQAWPRRQTVSSAHVRYRASCRAPGRVARCSGCCFSGRANARHFLVTGIIARHFSGRRIRDYTTTADAAMRLLGRLMLLCRGGGQAGAHCPCLAQQPPRRQPSWSGFLATMIFAPPAISSLLTCGSRYRRGHIGGHRLAAPAVPRVASAFGRVKCRLAAISRMARLRSLHDSIFFALP